MSKFDINVTGYLREKYGEEVISDVVAYEVKRDPDGTTTLKLTLVVGETTVEEVFNATGS